MNVQQLSRNSRSALEVDTEPRVESSVRPSVPGKRAPIRWFPRQRLGFTNLICFVCLALCGCRQSSEYPSRPILLVCPWAQGGGTDRCSRMVAAHLEQILNVPVNVVNATGGKGVTGHHRGLTSRPDGYTLTMATLELNTMHWIGLTSLTVEDCEPLMSINEDYAAVMVRSDSPWQTLKDLEADIRANPGELKASGTTTGGAWHLALAGWLLNTGLGAESVTWISSTGSAPSLQELASNGIDLVCCSLPEADTFIASGQVRALGVMSPKRATGYDNIETFAEQGTNWSLGGWRAVAIPLGTPEPIRAKLQDAMQRIMAGETKVGRKGEELTFAQFMQQAQFDNTIRTGEELKTFLSEADAKLGKLLNDDAMSIVREDPFSPHIFPGIVGTLMGIVLVTLAVTSRSVHDVVSSDAATLASEVETEGTTSVGETPVRGGKNLFAAGFILLALAAYWLFAETAGFVLICGIILAILFAVMRAPLPWAVALTIGFPVVVYQLFAHVLRVPLPQGWMGW